MQDATPKPEQPAPTPPDAGSDNDASESVEAAAVPQIRVCRQGHNLVKRSCDKSDEEYDCDTCGGSISLGAEFFDCRKCDFSVCNKCRMAPPSKVKEVKQKTLDDWRAEVAQQRKAPEKGLLPTALLDASQALLKGAVFQEAAKMAKEAGDLYLKVGSRWRLGVSRDIVAKAHLKLLEAVSEQGAASTPGQRQKDLRTALDAAEEAVALLREIGHPDEERDLASARSTLATLRALEVPSSRSQEALSTGPLEPAAAASKAAPATYYIAGTWDDYKPTLMAWDGQYFVHEATIGEVGMESFQLLLDGSWAKTLYPSVPDANPFVRHSLQGPDERGHGKNWTIGAHERDQTAPGTCYQIVLTVDGKGRAASVAWAPVLPEAKVLEIEAEELHVAAHSFLDKGQLDEAAQLAREAAECFQEAGSRWRTGIAWEMVARARLIQIEKADNVGTASTEEIQETPDRRHLRIRRDLHHSEALHAAGAAVALLHKIGKSSEEDDYLRARATVSKVLQLEIDRHVAKNDQEGCADMLFAAAKSMYNCGALEVATEVAGGAAMHYEKLERKKLCGECWELAAKAHLALLWGKEALEAGPTTADARQQRSEHGRAGREAALRAVEILSIGEVDSSVSLARARRTLIRARALELSKGYGDLWLELLRESWAPCKTPLKKTFGYADGLGKPPRFQRFDIREDVCKAVGGFTHGQVVTDRDGGTHVVIGVKECAEDGDFPRLWVQPRSITRAASCAFPGLGARALQYVFRTTGAKEVLKEGKLEDFDLDQDSEGELTRLCHECLLPLGKGVYASPDEEGYLHGECMGQILLETAEAEDAARQQEAARHKSRVREEYYIGWKPDRFIPRNEDFFRERRIAVPRGVAAQCMCCLVLEDSMPPSVRLVRTSDPECAVNLAYLAMALQVRLKAKMAPYFSLDTPHTDQPWQVKTYGPSWLNGTCIGEVLFQADYHLKELSMGDFDQPVAGMRSVWDFPWHQENWRGREWFVVRNAKVYLSDNNVLLPHVDMGVEARQQVADETHHLVDSPVTTADHPLVKYAEIFTRNFDLIAERKSVVNQLREVSKASIMAKFLLDNKVNLEDFWLAASENPMSSKLELPISRNERCYYDVLVCDGVIKEVQNGVFKSTKHISGGVDLNIDAFDLSAPIRVSKSVEKQEHTMGEEPRGTVIVAGSVDLGKLSQRELRRRIQEAGGQPRAGPVEKSELVALLRSLLEPTDEDRPAPAAAEANEAATSITAGVADEAGEVEFAALEEELRKLPQLAEDTLQAVLLAARRVRSRLADGAAQDAFWETLRGDSETAALLRAVFDSPLCDRRRDGGLFTPPVTSAQYLSSLKVLVEEERKVQEERKRHFLSEHFVPNAAGPLFPTSWRTSFTISFGRGASASAAAGGSAAWGRCLLPSEADGSSLLQIKPQFDRRTEDGTHFRIYRSSSLEVRTIVETASDQEKVGAVFEIQRPNAPSEHHPVVKVIEFVRSAEPLSSSPQTSLEEPPSAATAAKSSAKYCHFVVYETDLGDAIAVEQMASGTPIWEENPPDLEERCARSRVLRAADCSAAGALVSTLRGFYKEASLGMSSRNFARHAFEWLMGAEQREDYGTQEAPLPLSVPSALRGERDAAM